MREKNFIFVILRIRWNETIRPCRAECNNMLLNNINIVIYNIKYKMNFI